MDAASMQLIENELQNISLFDLVEDLSNEKHSELHGRLQSMRSRQDHILSILDEIGKDFERNVIYVQDNIRKIDGFRSKLNSVRSNMIIISERIESLQIRLNKARAVLPSNSLVLMEQPNEHGTDDFFYYRCIVPSGLKYRTKPSTSAPVIPGPGVRFKDIVVVKERVFICKEETVFLHVGGAGWLFENLERVKCLQRIGPSFIDFVKSGNTQDNAKQAVARQSQEPSIMPSTASDSSSPTTQEETVSEKSNGSSKKTFLDI